MTTLIAHWNGNINNYGYVIFHLSRASIVLGVLHKGLSIGQRNQSLIPNILAMFSFLWFLICLIGLAQFMNIIDTDVYYPNEELFTGFLGMDKPQIALISVLVVNILLYLNVGHLKWLKNVTLMLSFLLVSLLGSRQGFVFIGMSFLFYLLFSKSNKLMSSNFIRILPLIALILCFGIFVFSFIENDERFKILSDSFESKNPILALLGARDPVFFESFQDMANTELYYFGNGLGTEEIGYIEKDEGVFVREEGSLRTYFEGEIFRVLWASGILGVFLYSILFFRFIKLGVKIRFGKFKKKFGVYGSLLLSLAIINILYSFGQFNLFTTSGQNIPFLYLIWFVLSLLYSKLSLIVRGVAIKNKVNAGHTYHSSL
ncbi:hypothetical protein [Ulvibacterium marinum]|uniref:hypothetical protein n=1 Tax=Ulvibacterium marinum TaxID=2419782 RepID=UPI0011C3510D|nr:hypothetical protein [Ulvibacterium marinum]